MGVSDSIAARSLMMAVVKILLVLLYEIEADTVVVVVYIFISNLV